MPGWVLLMVWVGGMHSAPATTTASFATRDACLNAGNQWLRAVNDLDTAHARAVCVPAGKKE